LNKESSSSGLSAGQTVLLVEDTESDSALFLHVARQAIPEAIILTVGTAAEAMQCLEGVGKYADRAQFPVPTMVFVDLGLPDMPGEQLVKWIRKQPQFKRLLIAVFSGGTSVGLLSELYRWGADSFLLKTSNTKELAANLRELTSYWVQRGLLLKPPGDAPASSNS
jgi:DNA-binding response OmpR family regulator